MQMLFTEIYGCYNQDDGCRKEDALRMDVSWMDGGASDDVTYQPICRPTATAQGRAGQGRSGQTVLPCCPTGNRFQV